MAILLCAMDADTQEALEVAVREASRVLSGSSDALLRQSPQYRPHPPSDALTTPPAGGVPRSRWLRASR